MADIGEPMSGSQEPCYDGDERVIQETFDSREDAVEMGRSLEDGKLDPFLTRAWHDWKVTQARDQFGRFTGGWTISIEYARPGPNYKAGDCA